MNWERLWATVLNKQVLVHVQINSALARFTTRCEPGFRARAQWRAFGGAVAVREKKTNPRSFIKLSTVDAGCSTVASIQTLTIIIITRYAHTSLSGRGIFYFDY